MQVVFLDFDGVLNADTAVVQELEELWTASWLVPEMVARLTTLIETTSARVVVSSSWRQRRSREELEEILATHGFVAGVLDVTPRLARPPEGEALVRSKEIQAWLAVHPEVESFVILDDDQNMGLLASHHVRVDRSVGLTDGDVVRARKILGAAPSMDRSPPL